MLKSKNVKSFFPYRMNGRDWNEQFNDKRKTLRNARLIFKGGGDEGQKKKLRYTQSKKAHHRKKTQRRFECLSNSNKKVDEFLQYCSYKVFVSFKYRFETNRKNEKWTIEHHFANASTHREHRRKFNRIILLLSNAIRSSFFVLFVLCFVSLFHL